MEINRVLREGNPSNVITGFKGVEFLPLSGEKFPEASENSKLESQQRGLFNGDVFVVRSYRQGRDGKLLVEYDQDSFFNAIDYEPAKILSVSGIMEVGDRTVLFRRPLEGIFGFQGYLDSPAGLIPYSSERGVENSLGDRLLDRIGEDLGVFDKSSLEIGPYLPVAITSGTRTFCLFKKVRWIMDNDLALRHLDKFSREKNIEIFTPRISDLESLFSQGQVVFPEALKIAFNQVD